MNTHAQKFEEARNEDSTVACLLMGVDFHTCACISPDSPKFIDMLDKCNLQKETAI